MFEKYLQEIGLSEKEAQIYLALLQVDSSSIQDIAKRTDINRTTVYPVLESLAKKGLVGEIQDGKKTLYQAAPPERLETFVERQKIMLDEKSKRLVDIIPELKGVQRESSEKPVVKYYEGRDGAISANLDFFNVKDAEGTGFFFFNKDLIDETFTKEEIAKVQAIRPKKQIQGISLYTSEKVDLPSNEITTRVKIDSSKYPIKCDLSIYEDRVMVVTLAGKVSSIFIQNKDFADSLKSLFKLAFDNIKK